MKHKIGRKLLSFLLTLAMLVGLMPGMSLTAYADDNPYASLKNTKTVITFDRKEWYLIDYDETTVTLLSKECVGASAYNSSGSYVEYANSTVKTEVNNWYNSNITEEAQTAVNGGGMFLLTTDEAKGLKADVLKCQQASEAEYNYWWLRSPGLDFGAACVNGDSGYVDIFGLAVDRRFGVRPALKLDLSKVVFDSGTNTFSLPVPEPVASVTPYGSTEATEYTDFADAVTAWTNESNTSTYKRGATLTLLADVETSSRIYVNTSVSKDYPMILDLNGYGIRYTDSTSNPVIYIDDGRYFKLTDTDTSSRKHYITLDVNGRGISVENSGMASDTCVEVTGGYITGGLGISGGGVYTRGSFIMDGGTIVGNTAGQGGGVFIAMMPTFTMTGGTITRNTASTNGGGVYTLSGTLILSGGAIITENLKGDKKNNVELNTGKKITVTGALSSNASIGVTMASPGVFTEGNTAKDYSANFTSDDNTYTVQVDGDELKLGTHEHVFAYSGTGDTITATCSEDGCDLPLVEGKHVATLTIAATGGTYNETTAYGATITDENSIKGTAEVAYFKATANGEKGESLTETPKNAGKYWAEITLGTGDNKATAHVVYDVAKADPTISTAPTAPAITYGEKLENSNLTGGAASVTGSFAWKDDTTAPAVADSQTAEYDVVFTPDDTNNYNTAECKVKLTVNPKEIGLLWTDTELTYNGQVQAPKAAATGLVSGDEGEVNVSVSGEQTNARTEAYTATAGGLTGGKAGNYTLPSGNTTTFTISPKSITEAVVTLDKTELTYSGSEQTVSVTAVSLDGVSLTATDYIVSGNTGTNKDNYTVTVTGTGNYKDAATADWKIVAKAMTVTSEPVSKTYDGNNYGITVNVTDPSSETTTVKYGTEDGTYDLNESPKFKDAGTHTVYFKVSGNADYSDYEGSTTVTISKKPVTANVSAEDKPYDGKTDATVTASVPAEALVSGDSIEINGLKGSFADVNVGTDKVVTVDSSAKSISGNGSGNYEVTIPAETTASISKSEPKVTKPGVETLTYNGEAQELVTAGTVTGGKLYYAVTAEDKAPTDESLYQASIPTATDAGTYYVWYKVVGDDNHTGIEPEVLKVEIIEKGETEIKTEVKKDDKSPEIKASNLTKDFAESTLSSEEKADIEEAINNGEDVDVDVYLEIKDISDTISETDKDKIKAAATNANNIQYFDISLFKEIIISGQTLGATSIHNLATPLKLTIGVPKSFPAVADGYTRTYVVLRLHDGTVTVLPTTLNADGTLSFETDKFSTYALAYTDVKKDTATTEETTTTDTPTTKVDTPTTEASKTDTSNKDNKISTGDKMNIGIVVMLMLDSGMAALYLALRKKMLK